MGLVGVFSVFVFFDWLVSFSWVWLYCKLLFLVGCLLFYLLVGEF